MATITHRIKGLDELLSKFQQSPKIVGEETATAMTQAVTFVQGEVRERTPVDRGRLRQSVTTEVRGALPEMRGVIGTVVFYGPYQEFGTGIYAEGGGGRSTPWVYKHHRFGWVRTRGNRARHMFREGLSAARGRVSGYFAAALKRVIARMSGGGA